MHGNLTADEAAELAHAVHAALGGGQLGADARPPEHCVQLPKGCDMLHRCAGWVAGLLLCTGFLCQSIKQCWLR